jgi:DNA-binding NtrC family response regulator
MIQNILCVDNDLETLAELVMHFEHLAPNVLSANTRNISWDLFISNDIDIVVLNQYLDSELCIDLIDEFQLINPKIGIFVLTGSKDFEFAVKCIDRGIWGLFEKPTNFPLLLEQLNRKLKKNLSNNFKKTELAQCSLCTKVNSSNINELNENVWVTLDQFLEDSYQLQIKQKFCLSCSKLTFDQVEKYLMDQIRKLKTGEIDLKIL